MRLEPGMDAPRFEMMDMYGDSVRLDQYAGRPVLLSFHRFAACPLCNVRTDQLNQYFPIWRSKGLQIIMFLQSTRAFIEKVNRQNNPIFPVIPDPEKAIYEQYGVETSVGRSLIGMGPWHPRTLTGMVKGYLPTTEEVTDMFLLPADFILTSDLKIHTAYYAKTAADNLSVRQISTVLDALQPEAVMV